MYGHKCYDVPGSQGVHVITEGVLLMLRLLGVLVHHGEGLDLGPGVRERVGAWAARLLLRGKGF